MIALVAGQSSAAAQRRPAHAFILGWPLANLGGVNEVVRNLAREFEQDGPLAPVAIENMDGVASEANSGGIPVLRLAFPVVFDSKHPVKSVIKSLLKSPRFFLKLRRLCEQYRIEVLNPHFVGLEHLALVWFKRLGLFKGRILLSFHGSDIRGMMQSRGTERYLSQQLLRGADQLIPCSEGLAEELTLFAPECATKIAAVPNGIDIDRFLNARAKAFALPERFERGRRILNIGAFEHKKGHDTLIRAFAAVRRSNPDACLIIAGQTRAEIDATRRLVSELDLNDDVLLLQDIPHAQVGALLRSAELFVLSSRWEKGVCGEGFAMALLEAAAAEKPVVSTRSCGVAELIEQGKSGSIVPTDDPDALAHAIKAMLDDPEDAARQARNLFERVAREFTWKEAHRLYLQLATGYPSPQVQPMIKTATAGRG